mmetsp:Transcript_11072/g.20128  ORF Transcript_11072/g.20128 Transcript_11072/m.20128 type:complete len:419 (+) Transcript_11072:42-1298(+)
MALARLVTHRPLLARQLAPGVRLGKHVGRRFIGFTATANAVKPEPVNTSYKKSLREVLLGNAVLKRAFSKTEEANDSRDEQSEQGNSNIVIIQQSGDAEEATLPGSWGLVSTVMHSYNRHHELELRPDDIWQAILTQLSFYVNGNAEALRDRFVDFEGKKTLVLQTGGTLFTADFGRVASVMVDTQIAANIKDPDLVKWLILSFTTTKENDRIVAAVTVMATMQAYFKYVMRMDCGIPKVTLLGTVEDWQQLRAKIDRLPEFDLQDKLMTKWHKLLSPVLDELVRSSEGHPDVIFWDRIVNHIGGGSGPSFLSGWVSVFAVFSDQGKWMGDLRRGNTWPQIDFEYLPVSAVAVPLLVQDHGAQYDTYMLAGQVAQQVLESGVGLSPRSDWCIAYEGKPKPNPESYQHGEIIATKQQQN